MDQYIVKDGKKLRLGYTTGSCAAAAAKAAAWMLLTGRRRERIDLVTPSGVRLDLQVHDIEMHPDYVSCSIEKDSGDDPDVTKGTHIFARVSHMEPWNQLQITYPIEKINHKQGQNDINHSDQSSAVSFVEEAGHAMATAEERIVIDGGEGIGRVTRRGLDQPPGAAAINSVPRKMIRENVLEVCSLMDYDGRLSVMIFAPEGAMLAKKTFNPRLGIEGGISILGTTGIVEPMSEQSLIDTIRTELRQRREEGQTYVLLTPGNYGEEYIREHIPVDPESAVMTSNFIGESLRICRELGFEGALLVGHIGKLIKIAGGLMNTHSKYGDCRMEIMTAYAAAEGLSAPKAAEMLQCATCDDGIRILQEEDDRTGTSLRSQTLKRIQERIAFIMDHQVYGEVKTGAVLFSRVYGWLCETDNARDLLENIQASLHKEIK